MGYRPTPEQRSLEDQWWVLEWKGTKTRCVGHFSYGRFELCGGDYADIEDVFMICRLDLDAAPYR